MSEIQVIEADVKKALQWIVTPAHLILIGLLAVSIAVGVYFHDAHKSAVADAKVAVAQEREKAAVEKAAISDKANAAIQANNKTTQDQLAAANTQLIAAYGQLAQAARARQQVTQQQQARNATLDPVAKAQRMVSLVPAGTVTPVPTGFILDPNEMLGVLNQLERVPQQAQDILGLQQGVDNLSKQLDNKEAALNSEVVAHLSDNNTCKDDKAALQGKIETANAEIGKLKADAKRNRWRHLLLGGILLEGIRIAIFKTP
jgi:hypothetical protein